MQVKVASFETCFISMPHLVMVCMLLLSFTTARWFVSAGSSPSVMQTTVEHDNLLATRAITGRFSTHHPLCNYFTHQQPATTSQGLGTTGFFQSTGVTK